MYIPCLANVHVAKIKIHFFTIFVRELLFRFMTQYMNISACIFSWKFGHSIRHWESFVEYFRKIYLHINHCRKYNGSKLSRNSYIFVGHIVFTTTMAHDGNWSLITVCTFTCAIYIVIKWILSIDSSHWSRYWVNLAKIWKFSMEILSK